MYNKRKERSTLFVKKTSRKSTSPAKGTDAKTARPCGPAVGKLSFRLFLAVKFGIERIEVLGIKLVGGNAQRLAKPLVMHDFPLAQKADRVAHVVVVAEAQDVVVRRAGFLLWGDWIRTTFD